MPEARKDGLPSDSILPQMAMPEDGQKKETLPPAGTAISFFISAKVVPRKKVAVSVKSSIALFSIFVDKMAIFCMKEYVPMATREYGGEELKEGKGGSKLEDR